MKVATECVHEAQHQTDIHVNDEDVPTVRMHKAQRPTDYYSLRLTCTAGKPNTL